MSNMIREFAIKAHRDVNHIYAGMPYEVHLQDVVDVANEYIALIPGNDRELVIAACWLHDTIEDCRLTYNDIKKVAGVRVADIVYALTNEKGKNRAERANEKYYRGIRETEYATFVKLCDRMANCSRANERMQKVYVEEYSHFKASLYTTELTSSEIAYNTRMWPELHGIIKNLIFKTK